jgi:alpha,alpha-trehalose phosphorylase
VIGLSAFSVEPWRLRETELNVELLPQTESLFALANGHVGWRGNLDEGEPHGLPGSYLCGVYETRPLPYAEAGYGNPESGQTVINVTNGKVIRLLVDDEPLDLRYGRLFAHERVLDFRAGTLERTVDWESYAHRRVRVSSTRLVSFTHRAIAAVAYEVEPIGDGPMRVVLQSELVANEQLPERGGDPRAAAALRTPLIAEEHDCGGTTVALVHSTERSGLTVAAAMDNIIESPTGRDDVEMSCDSFPDLGRATVTTRLRPGEKLRIVKLVAYGWSRRRSRPALVDQVNAALAGARQVGWDGLAKDQRDYLDDFWGHADVELDGDEEIQQAVRFGLFHVLQSGARAETRAIAAKGLTGPGYDGHTFWDTETFVLPVLTYTAPHAAADALRWRHTTLPRAKERATQLGLAGAAFPWRTIHGEECSGYWPAGTAAFHVSADIADAVVRYLRATDDRDFGRETGLELLIETARLWRSLGHHDHAGVFRVDGVTGPDEYTAVVDNNVYTNLMAARNLRSAAEAAEHHPRHAAAFGVDPEEIASWRQAASDMYIPYDDALEVHQQSEGFTGHEEWNFASTRPDQYPLLLHFPYFDIYRKQVVKQADLVLAMLLCGDEFTDEQKERGFAYYERLTVRDSSLSACVQAAVAAEIGHLALAYDYLTEAALMDLHDLERNTGDGLHVASLAGAWIALVSGFGGMREHDGEFSFAPRLPEGLSRLAFMVQVRGRCLRVETDGRVARYRLMHGEPLRLRHHGTELTADAEHDEELPVPPAPQLARPEQPHGRAPVARRTSTSHPGAER